MAAVDGLGDPDPVGMGKLGRLGLEPAVRYERQRPGELIHIDVKKLGRIQRGAGKRSRDGASALHRPAAPTRRPARRKTVGWEYVHVAIDDATRLAYVEVLADEKAMTAVGFLAAPCASSRATASGRGADHRQRLGLPLDDPRDRLPRARHPSPAHPPLPPADQRQSRALHPHAARRLGLRRDLPRQRRAHRRARRLARRYNHQRPHGALSRQAAHRSAHRAEQPARVLHLARQSPSGCGSSAARHTNRWAYQFSPRETAVQPAFLSARASVRAAASTSSSGSGGISGGQLTSPTRR